MDEKLLFQYLREELQYLILFILYSRMRYPIYFMGGTKLRLSYGINRFSEDIDLALDKPNPVFPAQDFFEELIRSFAQKVTGFQTHSTFSARGNVVKIMLSFSQLLFDLKLSPLPAQTIKIKIELDINPPAHAEPEKKTYRSLAGDYLIHTHNLSTTFAGKMATVLFRAYQKGRDYYDLQWYLQQRPGLTINLDYFNANARQQGEKAFKNERAVFTAMTGKVKNLDLPLMKKDLERFVTMSPATFQAWLNNYIPETLSLLKTYQSSHES